MMQHARSGPFAGRLLLAVFAVLAAILLAAVRAEAAASASDSGEVKGRRAALVIGNSDYEALPHLPNAVNDAQNIAKVLEDANFEVTLAPNVTKLGLEKAVREFLRTLNDGDVALFYYSGHAVQVAGENYILPVDAHLTSAYDLEVESQSISNILEYMRASSAMQILILDSCRNNPFGSGEYYIGDKKVDAGKAGLAALTPRQGSLIVYSTAPNQVAYDGGGDMSPFTGSLSDDLLTPNIEVRQLLSRVRSQVIDITGGRQVPWDVSSLISDFYFVKRQNLLIMGESLGELHVSPEATRVNLGIMPPVASAGMDVKATFDKMPKSGDLYLGDTRIEPGTAIDASRIQEVDYVTKPGDKPVELIPYSIHAEGNRDMQGVVALVFDSSVAPPQPDQPVASQLSIADAGPDKTPASGVVKSVDPVRVAMAAEVGTGFLSISDALPAKSAQLASGWLRLQARPASTQVSLDGQLLNEGDVVPAKDVERLRIRPTLDAVADKAKVVLAQAAGATITHPSLVIDVDAKVDRCDELAGDPLDIQGVTEGIYPNDIKVDAALAACQQAVDDYPGVARFHHELGRVLYAKGEYDAAIKQFETALAGGHVRSGQVLGRFYQLGAGVTKDPAKAVPLFKAAAAKGDAYAEYSLGRALMDGRGAKEDVKQGLDLLNQAAELGHTYAFNQLGAEYLSGARVPKDVAHAVRLFQASAARGDVWGMVNLGILYRDGTGVAKDVDKAKELFSKAHDGLHPYAGTLLALVLRDEGKTGNADLFKLFHASAERGDSYGAYYAAKMIEQDGSLGSRADAIHLYALSVARGGDNGIAKAARARLAALEPRAVNVEIQRTLQSMGAQGIALDGKVGSQTRAAAAQFLNGPVPSDPTDLLADLVGKEWIASQPRLDML